MLKVFAHEYMELGLTIQVVYSNTRFIQGKGDEIVPPEELTWLLRQIDNIKHHCDELDLSTASLLLLQKKQDYQKVAPSWASIRTDFDWLGKVLAIEMQTRLFLYVPPHRAKFYETPQIGALSDAHKKFPSAWKDHEKAATCYAVGRYTACVFHLMRVLEVSVRALGLSLGDPAMDPKKNPTWQAILQKCDDELKKPLNSRSAEWKKDDQFFATATANLRAVKDAWRNPTMHIECDYTEGQALDVLNAVYAFARQIASKLDEIGRYSPTS